MNSEKLNSGPTYKEFDEIKEEVVLLKDKFDRLEIREGNLDVYKKRMETSS